MRGWGLRLIGDSGAFSADSQNATIDRDAFYEWAVRWQHDLYWIASLDVIGDLKQSWANWRAAPPGLRLVPTVHYGAPVESIDRYVEAGADLIGLGGMVPFKSESPRLLRWCLAMMRYARDNHPHVRFHGWGVTHPQLMMNLPWWSVDSSGYSASFRYGRMTLFDPEAKCRVGVVLDGKDMARHRDLLRRHYGVDWRDVATSTAANRRAIVRVSLRTYQLMEHYLQNRHRVTAPRSLSVSAPLVEPAGPLVHSVLGAPSMQPGKSVDPEDRGPRIHAVIGVLHDAEHSGPPGSVARERNRT
jgi:hypothetical protein